MAYFLISSKVLGRLDQLQVIWLLYIIELSTLLIDLGFSNCSTWYIQRFWQGLACWTFPQTFALWNFGSLLWSYFLFFFNNKRLPVIVDRKFSQEFPFNSGVLHGSILGPTLFLLYINGPCDVICNVTIYADDTTLYSKCDQAFNLLQQLELAYELAYEIWYTQHCGLWAGSGLLVSMQEKFNWFWLF